MAESDIPNFKPMTPPSPERGEGPGEIGGVPPVQSAPPTFRPHYERPRVSSWPMVVGIICIVLGAMGALGGVCGLVGTLSQGFFAGVAQQAGGQPIDVMTAMQQYVPYLLVSNVLNMMVAIALIAGGSGLTSRRRWGRTVLLHWSWVRMIAVVLGAVLAYLVQQAQFEAMMNDPNAASAPVPIGMMMRAAGGVGLVFTLVWGWALPIFNLIWLNRKVIRDEANTWS